VYIGGYAGIYLAGKGWKIIDWINLAHDRYWWRALENTVRHLLFHNLFIKQNVNPSL
jgi:hypothetical protein